MPRGGAETDQGPQSPEKGSSALGEVVVGGEVTFVTYLR